MTSPTGLHHHHYADELLEDYILGTLSAEETAWMRAHVETCSRCQAELESLRGTVHALPFSAPEPDVPISDDLWDRIERSISTSPGATGYPGTAAPEAGPSNIRSLPQARNTPRLWLMVAALMLVSLVSGVVLARALPQMGEDDAGVQRIAAEFTDPSVDASGELLYLPEEHVFVLDVTGMPELPEGYVYQAWLTDGDVPTSVGLLNAGTEVFATAGDRDNLQMFCVTVEPGPLGNEAPTTDPVLIVPLETAENTT
jgi:anti-sigma factor RsiW